MPRLRFLLFPLALLAGVATGGAEEGLPIVRTFLASETGGGETFWSAAQDAHGVMYFGSDQLITFDGEHWAQHRVPGAVAIRGLAVDRHNRVWIGGINELGYFDRVQAGGLSSYHSLVSALPPGSPPVQDIWQIFVRQDGMVLFFTNDAVLMWNGTRFVVHLLPGARRLIVSRIGDRVYVGHAKLGLWELTGDQLKLVVPTNGLQDRSVFWTGRQNGRTILVTHRGLAWLDGDTLTPIPSDLDPFLSGSLLTAVSALPDGRLCLGTAFGGIVITTPLGDQIRFLGQKDGLPSSNVMGLFTDRDGAIWVMSTIGPTRINVDGSASLFSGAQGLTGRGCRNLTQAGDRLLVSTDDGIFGIDLTVPGPVQARLMPELESKRYLITSAPDGLYASGVKGVTRLADGKVTSVYSTATDILLFRASTSPPGSFLLAANFDLVRLTPMPDGSMHSVVVSRLPDLPNTVVEDNRGSIWLGTSAQGVLRVPAVGGEASALLRPDGQPFAVPTYLERAGESIALGDAEGLVLLDPATHGIRPIANAPVTPCLAMSNPGPSGVLWMVFKSPFTSSARIPIIGRLTTNPTGKANWSAFAVPGLRQAGEITRLFVDSRGIVWLGGSEGALRLDPDRLKPVTTPSPPLLSTTIVNSSAIPAQHDPITFEFAAAEYDRPEAVRFQTMLSGSTKDWSPPTDVSHLTLAGLRDNDYEFSVRVINDAGLTSAPSTWRFTVLPPWYRTKLAYTAWTFFALAGFFGAVQWRSAYLRIQNARLESLIQKKTAQLEKANAAKSEFLANMSHEIRNPISGIVGLSLAMEETVLDQRQRQLTDSIRSCAALLATLVDDVLDFSKIEAGRIELRPAPFDLRASLEQCVAMVAEDIRKSGGRASVEFSPELTTEVVGDSARVQQIVLNYLTNAVKFAAGQPIVVGAEPALQQRIRLFVRDHGPGMSAAEVATLFTKFTRLESARSGNIRGSGLGLAVCRLLAHKMGGVTGVDSKPGGGSCFWVDLPLPSAAPPGTGHATPAPAATPLRALIVEDIDYNAIAMQAVLRRLGVASEVASDGPTALAKLQASFYDVAFMDWNLPGMIGTEVVARYRAVESPSRRTIIIATTAYSADFNREACLQAGMDAFIAKPFTPEKIAAALRDLRGSLRAAASVEVHQKPSPPPPPPTADIDLQMLRFLADETPEGLSGQIDRYLASYDSDRRALAAALPTGDAKEIHRLAHRLVSHATVVKCEPLIRLARELQGQAASADAARLAGLFAEFEREFGQLTSKLDSCRASTAPA